MKSFFSILVLSLFLTTCHWGKEELEVQNFEVNVHQLSERNFDDFFKLKEVIKLSTTDSSLMGDIKKVIAAGDRLFIITYSSPEILVFNRKGDFLTRIDKQGKGPGEYLKLIDINVTEVPRELIVYCRTGRLYFYDWEGNFIREQKVDSHISNIEYLDGKGWLTNHGLVQSSKFNGSRCILRTATKDSLSYFAGCSALPPDYNLLIPIDMCSPLYCNEGKYYGIPIVENTIYEFNSREAAFKPRYRFNVREFPVPDENTMSTADPKKPFVFEYFIFTSEYVSKKYILLNAWCANHKENSLLTFLADKKSGKVEVFAELSDQESDLPLFHFFQHRGFQGGVVAYTTGTLLQDYKFEQNNSIGRRLKAEIKEADNPVLLVYEER